jgi:hypothetical protein
MNTGEEFSQYLFFHGIINMVIIYKYNSHIDNLLFLFVPFFFRSITYKKKKIFKKFDSLYILRIEAIGKERKE